MTEDEAREWLLARFGPSSFDVLERYVALLLDESNRQSLIAKSTFDNVWSRHVADSAQLIDLAPAAGVWVDVGSGGGLPGMVVAALRPGPMTLVEPRRRRAEFLTSAAAALGLRGVSVVHGTAQSVATNAMVISARAVSNLNDLFSWTVRMVSRETRFVLPRGATAKLDLDIAQRSWRGTFHVEQSITDAGSGIVVATDVRPA